MASAQTTKADAQKQLDDAKAKSCAVTQKSLVTNYATKCPEESAAVAKIKCDDAASYKMDDYMKPNQACMDKVKAAAGKSAETSKSSSTAAAKDRPQTRRRRRKRSSAGR